MPRFHNRLKKYREAKGIAVKKMAQELGVSESTYREWEYGRAIQGEPYLKMSELLDVSVFELLGGTAASEATVLSKVDSVDAHLKELRRLLQTFF